MSERPYWQKLQSPQWQRRRLERLQQAEFICEVCQDGETQLHVHHLRYIKGREPWEYADHELRVLCESCHTNAHADRNALIEALLMVVPGAGPDDLELTAVLAGWIEARNPQLEFYVSEKVAEAVEINRTEFEAAKKAAEKLIAKRRASYKRFIAKLKQDAEKQQHSGL